MSLNRTDRASDMKLVGYHLAKTDSPNVYVDIHNLLLPQGTYGLLIDGRMTDAVIKVSARPAAK